jgi:hypothetical protein
VNHQTTCQVLSTAKTCIEPRCEVNFEVNMNEERHEKEQHHVGMCVAYRIAI